MLKTGNNSLFWWRHKYACLYLIGLALLLGQLTLPPLAAGQTIQEVRVQWSASPPVPPGAPGERRAQSTLELFSIVSRQTMRGRLARQREPELSSDKVVVIARDSGGKILDLQVVADARIVRAEAPGPGGELSGKVLYRDRADFLFALPDDPGISRIDFYQPRWTASGFELDLIGGVPLK